MTIRVVPIDLVARASEALRIEQAALAQATGQVVPNDRGGIYARHVERPAFRAVGAVDESDQLLAFGYGYEEPIGGWWDSHVRPAMINAGVAHVLMDAWTLVELHVLPERQGKGLGRALLKALVGDLPYRYVILTTQRDQNPSRHFYHRLGFEELAPVEFPGLPPFVVLGRTLPLPA